MKGRKQIVFTLLIVMILNIIMPITTYSVNDNITETEDSLGEIKSNSKEIFGAGKDIGKTGLDYINQGAVVIYARDSNGKWTNGVTDEDGQLISPQAPTLATGQGLMFRVKWSISNIQGKNLENGDYFEFNLPSNYFDFTNSGEKPLTSINESTGQE